MTRPWLRRYPAKVAWDQAIPPGTLLAMLEEACAAFAHRPALDFLGRRLSYAQLRARVHAAAEGFRRLGAGPGTRVAICLPNSAAFVIAYFGAMTAGAAVTALSPLHVEDDMAAQLRDSGAEILVCSDLDPLLPRALALLAREDTPVRHLAVAAFPKELPWLKGWAFRLLKRRQLATVPAGDARLHDFDAWAGLPAIAAPHPARPEEPAVLQYTGGTTGTPKAAVLTHGNLSANARQVMAWFTTSRPGGEVTLAVIPFFHVFAMTVAMNVGLFGGSCVVMQPRFDWAMLKAALRRTRPTVFPGVPTLFKALLDRGATPALLKSVKACISGGAPLPAQVKADFEALAGCTLVEGYGLTESSPVAFCNPLEGENRAGTIGVPLPGVVPSLRSLEDPAREVPAGERGELCLKGPNVMAGYWNRPAETAAAFTPDGFLRTGDVGVMDEDGYVTLVDRIKDLILVSGFNVYPRTVEEAIWRHPEVAAVTVVGMPDASKGEVPAAFVQPREGSGLTAEALRDFLQGKLSPIEMPRHIELRAELPRTAVGKLSKKELRAELQERPRP
ncbi:long-chain-fatty-acid--CoA ligase [Roseococcus sp. DSY-14]|uniref:long-chain-fatty-acid--CoA ligase n=1 Tax=Roseococcus sp. DSY-14 TaxID=3369650 RepID=UPI00387AE2E2